MTLMQQPVVQALAKALVHFLWQGALLAASGAVISRLIRPSAPVRYGLGVLCLALMAITPIATTTYFVRTSGAALSVVIPAGDVASSAPASGTALALTASADTTGVVRALVVCLWLSGVLVLSVRLVGGWIVTRRIVARARGLAAPEIRALAHQVAIRLSLARVVEVFESSTVAVPMMIGWIAPVVILPAAATAGLTPMQIEALLAHELAHVRRHDYLVNLLQSVVETLLFYHPAVWWVSRDVRESREHCCDDMAIAVCDRVVYASALADLAAMSATPRLALAATDGSLVTRVRRILGRGDARRPSRPEWLPAALLILGAVAVVPVVAMSRPQLPVASPGRTEARIIESGQARTPTAVSVATPQDVATEHTAATSRLADSDQAPLAESPSGDQFSQNKMDALRDRLTLIQAERDGSPQLTSDQARVLDGEVRQLQIMLERLRELRGQSADIAKMKDQLRAMDEQLDVRIRALKQARDGEDLPVKKLTLDRQAKELTELARKQALDADDQKLKELAVTKAKLAESEVADLSAKLAALDAHNDAQREDEVATAKVRKDGKVDGIDQQTALSLLGHAGSKRETVIVVGVRADGPALTAAEIKLVRWEAGTTVQQALERAGIETTRWAGGVSRLSGLTVSLDDGDTHYSVRTEAVGLDVVLRAGDVLVVTGGGR